MEKKLMEGKDVERRRELIHALTEYSQRDQRMIVCCQRLRLIRSVISWSCGEPCSK